MLDVAQELGGFRRPTKTDPKAQRRAESSHGERSRAIALTTQASDEVESPQGSPANTEEESEGSEKSGDVSPRPAPDLDKPSSKRSSPAQEAEPTTPAGSPPHGSDGNVFKKPFPVQRLEKESQTATQIVEFFGNLGDDEELPSPAELKKKSADQRRKDILKELLEIHGQKGAAEREHELALELLALHEVTSTEDAVELDAGNVWKAK